MSLFRLITTLLQQIMLTQAKTLDGKMISSSYMNYVKHIIITKQLYYGLESARRNSQIYTRWNSHVKYAVIALFVIPERHSILDPACDFICYKWTNPCFHSQHYNEESFNELFTSLTKIKCKKAIKCLETHWSVEESLINIPRSNQTAENAVKLNKELHAKYRKIEFLNLKFIGKNIF